MDTAIRMPFMERRRDNLHITKGPLPNGATAFLERSFVKYASAVLTPCVTDDIICFGQAPGPSHSSTDLPPVSLYGNLHWCFDPRHAIFIVNITDASGNIGQANGAPQLSEVTIGQQYALYRNADGYQMMDVDDTTNDFFRVIGIYPNQSLTDYNGLVLVELVESVIQAG